MSDYSGLIAELQRSCNGLNNKVKSLEETQKQIQRVILIELFGEDMENYKETDRITVEKKIEALESAQKWILNILCSDDYGSIIPQLKKLRKRLEEDE